MLRYFLFFTCFLFLALAIQAQSPPNVLLIITDDQGYGDFGFTGNPHVRTPQLDSLAGRSVYYDNFYVSPVCAPTRASLMTGRYSLRTGIRDTYNGGAIMATEEVTIAEMLRAAGYRTGIFGKWHLGDNYPSRPSEQGFDESLIHLSGGMAQVGDFTTYFQGDRAYFDPVLWHNNEQRAYQGYCSDIFTRGAIDFIEKNREQPFFCYLSFNAPHTPLQVPEEYYQKYQNLDPTAGFSPEQTEALPQMTDRDQEDARRVYAMVENIDDNLGRLFTRLRTLGIENNTLIIFLTDNGPQQRRYKAGLRGRKGRVYRGGVRVPLLMHYPAGFAGERTIKTTTAHLDLLPTLAELTGAQVPNDRVIDGHSLVPLLQNEPVEWENRSLFFYWTRKYPELYNNIALQQGPWKLVGNTSYQGKMEDLELYRLMEDPGERNNLIAREPSQAQELKEVLDETYRELIRSPHLVNPPRIEVGHPAENPIFLNRNDASGERGIWSQEEVFGKWRVRTQAGVYRITYKFIEPVPGGGKLYLETNQVVHQKSIEGESIEEVTLEEVRLPAMDADLIPFYQVAGKRIFPFWLRLERIDKKNQ